MATSGSTRWFMDASTLSCIKSAIRRFGRTPSLSASSFTTTAPRIEISRVETDSDIVGFAAAAVAAVVRMDTDENPARVPPTRIGRGRCGSSFDGAAGTFSSCFATGLAACFGCAFWTDFGGGGTFCCCTFCRCALAALPVG